MSAAVPCCLIIPSRVLQHYKDLDSALLSERLRGHRVPFATMTLGAVSTGEKHRTIYDAAQGKRLPGKFVRGEGSAASTDTSVNEAYDSSGDTYEFYKTVFGRNSIDGHGLRIDSTVHYAKKFNNAFWNGRQMVYGDGDGHLFKDFPKALDVVAHELTHGVTQYTVPGGLTYDEQSGALNESVSDVFGSLAKQWKRKQTAAQADWLIGAEIIANAPGFHALRSMKDPGNTDITYPGDDQPKDMDGYVQGGDVHTNSGIPNRAFYLAAVGIGGHAWEKAGRIWYRALPMLTANATFKDAAQTTLDAANILFGRESTEWKAVNDAWRTVKVL